MTHPAVANGTYDVERIRRDFPILAMPVYGKSLIYLDNAASAQKPRDVLDRMYKGYTTEYANVHRGLHFLANAATEAYEAARDKVRGFLNAARREEIIFTRNATEAINLVPGRRHLRARAHQARRRDRALDHGTPFQHRALAFPARAPGNGDPLGTGG
jgi:selenocysteine lyase/cysteine desulfurase